MLFTQIAMFTLISSQSKHLARRLRLFHFKMKGNKFTKVSSLESLGASGTVGQRSKRFGVRSSPL